MRPSLLFLGVFLCLAGCPKTPPCSVDIECDDQNPCTLDACSQEQCVHAADDGAVPPQSAADDCLHELCNGGAIVSFPDDAETPPQAGAACLVEVCQGGEVTSEPAAPGAGGCLPNEFCDADAGCQPGLRDLAQAPGNATLFGDEPQAHLTDFTGLAVGDFDGDGDIDIAAAEPDKDTDAGAGPRLDGGEIRVALGPFANEVDLASAPSLRIFGAAAGDHTGLALASCDFDGDERDDLVLSASSASPNGLLNAGVVFGVKGPLPASLDLSLAVGPDLLIEGDQASTFSPDRLLCLDLNGDGADDLILGAENHDAGGLAGAGLVSIFLGGDALSGTKSLSQADLTIQGHSAGMHLGGALGAADLDGDGKEDLVLGAPRIGQNQARPETVIILVHAGLFDAQGLPSSSVVSLGNNAVFLDGGARGQFGFAFSSGDFDADGRDDFAIGALLSDPQNRQDAGEVDIVYGQAGALESFALDADPARRTAILGFDPGDETGISLAAGDHNGDGRDDLLLGAHKADGFGNATPGCGEAFLFLGGAPLDAGQVLDLTTTSPALVIFGRDQDGAAGKQLQMFDIDLDGKQDLLLGAPFGAGPTGSGRAGAGNISLLLAP